ncbi:MAG: GNAT family N-acetyltransferase [Lachnospiraceae bacterium]|nr:GNAT family N-acetyltransferase [Lachnospiraceae bacterium]
MVCEIQNGKSVESLFGNWQESLIWSCLDGTMGHLYADTEDEPASVMAILGDFCFFAGKPKEELLLYKPEWCQQDFIIMVPQTGEWADLIEKVYKEKAKKVKRYATKKEEDIFDREKLRQIVSGIEEPFTLKKIDARLFKACRAAHWSADLVSQYADYDMYQRLGIGVMIVKDGEIVAGASSYSRYGKGIEIEIDTEESYRRRGLASICGAELILECLDRGLYPSWDAQNKGSLDLAEKLGYHFAHTYQAYEIWGYKK